MLFVVALGNDVLPPLEPASELGESPELGNGNVPDRQPSPHEPSEEPQEQRPEQRPERRPTEALPEEVAPDSSETPPPESQGTPSPEEVVPQARLQTFILQAPSITPHVASIVAGQLVGDETPELVVGLGSRVDILQLEDGTLRRIATIHIEQAEPGFVPSTPRAAIGDVSGDGQADLLVPYWRRTRGGGSRGGGAVILRGKADGSLDRPRRFAGPRMMVSSIALMDLDGRGGLDVILGGRGRPYGDIPGRIAYYRGGRMPRLIREQRTNIKEIRFVLPVDIGADDKRDLVVVGETLVRYRHTTRDRFEPLEETHPGILFADAPHAISYRVPGRETIEAVVHTVASNSTTVVNTEGVHRVGDNFETGLRDVRLSWIRAVVANPEGSGRQALAIGYIRHGWVIGRLNEEGEPIDITELHGGHPRAGVDAVLVEEEGSPMVYGLETFWDHETGAVTWQVLRFPFCRCDYERIEADDVTDDAELAEWTIR